MPKQEKKPTTKRTKRDKNEIDDSEYMRPILSPTRVANEPNDDDPPSIEKHGFWMFPRKPHEKFATTGKKRSKDNNPCNDEEKPVDRQNMIRMQQRCPPFRPMFLMGCQCFCHRPPCCPCRQWMIQSAAKCFGAMPIAKVQNRDFQSASRVSDAAKKTKNQPVNKMSQSRIKRAFKNGIDDMVEFEGRKDMELASIMVNDAKLNFNRAISEQHLKDDARSNSIANSLENQSQAKNRISSVGNDNETWQVNRASEKFRKIVKEENDANIKLGLKKTTDGERKDEVNDQERGFDRLSLGTSTLMSNKSNENFMRNVKDAQTENEQLLIKKTEEPKKRHVSRIRSKRSKGKK